MSSDLSQVSLIVLCCTPGPPLCVCCVILFFFVFCLLVLLVRLSVPVQVERLVSEMTYNVLMRTLNPAHSHSLTAGVAFYKLLVYEAAYVM